METTIEKLESDIEIEKELAKQLRAENERLRKALENCISALAWLPPDQGPIRRRAEEAIHEARAALEDKQ